ncbi:MAG: arsenite efflux transporter metallochaperone ArsD [Bacillota bacterium]
MSEPISFADIEDRTGPEPDVVIEIFDPPMCCPSGLCGPAVDPALLAISEAILALKRQYGSRVRVERYLLSQQAGAFMKYPDVFSRLQEAGTAVLPLTTVNGAVVRQGSYPTLEELQGYVGDADSTEAQPDNPEERGDEA